MGVFNKTDREKMFTDLIRAVRATEKIDKYEKNDLINLLVNIKTGKVRNEFIDDEILTNVVYHIVSSRNSSSSYGYLRNVIDGIKFMLPQGDKTEHFEEIKEEILNYCLGEYGFDSEFFNKELYSVFKDSKDYFKLISIIVADEELRDSFDEIVEFAVTMGKEIDDNDQLKREIVSYLHAAKNIIDDPEAYLEKRIKETRMKYGIYPGLDEKTASEISREVEKGKSMLLRLETIDRKVNQYKKEIDKKTKEGASELTADINKAKLEIRRDLDEYLDDLKEQLKSSSETAYEEILEAARDKAKQIRIAVDSIGKTTTRELIRVRDEADKKVAELKDFASSDKDLQETLKIARENEDVINGVLAIQSGSVQNPTAIATVPGLIVPDSSEEDFLVPQFEMTTGILPAFDKTVAFDKRMKEVEANIKQMEQEGYLIPDTIYEALPWFILGNKVIYFYGPTQSGKTTLVDILTKAVGTQFIDGGKITEEHSVTSFNDVRGKFDENQLYYALYYGLTAFYDEMDNGNPNNLVLLGTYISSLANKIAHPEKDVRALFAKRRSVPINVNARIIAAGNTSGKGRNREYTARNRFDESTQERIVPFYIGYNEKLEEKIFGNREVWYKFFKNFRANCLKFAVDHGYEDAEGNLTTSDASTIKEIVDTSAMTVSPLMRGIFTQTKEEDYLDALITLIKGQYKIQNTSIEQLNKIPLKDLTGDQIATAFVHESNARIKKIGAKK